MARDSDGACRVIRDPVWLRDGNWQIPEIDELLSHLGAFVQFRCILRFGPCLAYYRVSSPYTDSMLAGATIFWTADRRWLTSVRAWQLDLQRHLLKTVKGGSFLLGAQHGSCCSRGSFLEASRSSVSRFLKHRNHLVNHTGSSRWRPRPQKPPQIPPRPFPSLKQIFFPRSSSSLRSNLDAPARTQR